MRKRTFQFESDKFETTFDITFEIFGDTEFPDWRDLLITNKEIGLSVALMTFPEYERQRIFDEISNEIEEYIEDIESSARTREDYKSWKDDE
jgi:hypothetical protein